MIRDEEEREVESPPHVDEINPPVPVIPSLAAPARCTKRLLNISDSLLTLLVITPLVVSHWRGIWAIMDRNSENFPPILCSLFGCLLHISFVLIRDLLHTEFHLSVIMEEGKNCKKCSTRFLAIRIYTYIFSLGCNMHWRGTWSLLETHFGNEFYTALLPTIICLIVLVAVKGVRNLLAPPTLILVDSKKLIFRFPTRFRVEAETMVRRSFSEWKGSVLSLKQNPYYMAVLEFLDVLISVGIIMPIIIAFWRSTFRLYDVLVFPSDIFLSTITTGAVGGIGSIFLLFSLEPLRNTFHPMKKRLTFYVFSRIYTFFGSWINLGMIRGIWVLLNNALEDSVATGVIITLIGFFVIIYTKIFKTLLATPFAIARDDPDTYFEATTRFKTSGSREPGLYVLDCIFSVLVVGTLVVVAWRGVWVILDLTLYPENSAFSAWGSLVIGYGIVAVTFAIQPLMKWACERLTGFWRIAVADIFLFLSFIGTVNVWRGVWHLLDIYFLPENRILSDWITHAVSFILLVLLNCSNSVLVRGVYIDAEEPAGQCVVFPIYYIRLFFQKERTKKQRKLIDALEKQDRYNTMNLSDKSQTLNNIAKSKTPSATLAAAQMSDEAQPILSHSNEKTTKNGENPSIKE